MRKFLFLGLGMASLFLGACASDDLEPEVREQPPAAYSPDPTQHLPRDQGTRGLGGGGRY